MIDKKQLIITYLKSKGLSSTSKIASNIKANQYQTQDYLLQLKEEGKVNNLSTPSAEYWEIKKGGKLK